MRLKNIKDFLSKQETPSLSSPDELKTWHSHKESLEFMLSTTEGDIPIYISKGNFFIYSLIVPLEKLGKDYIADLLNWSFPVSSGYGYGSSCLKGESIPCIWEPMELTGSEILDNSLPIFFLRGFPDHEQYIEINQRVSHVLNIHWVPEKNAWCKLNDLGEKIPVAYSIKEDDLILCTFLEEELEFYLFLANSCLIRFFDIYRSRNGDSLEKEEHEKLIQNKEAELFARWILYGNPENPVTSIIRGFQIIRNKKSREELFLRFEGKEPRKFASFLIWDWKHGKVIEWSSDPEQIGNYFVPSDLPFGTSPAFFKPEVLLRYRQDPSRFQINDRWIHCKGAWSIRYDINEEGQVHVYICDLSQLPYEEQLHWKAFNEPPKAGLSQRALKTDFDGEWDNSYNPLQSLKAILSEFPQKDEKGNPCQVWQMPPASKTSDLIFLEYVVTGGQKEWKDQILALSNILVDGLNTRYINSLAEALSCRDEKLGSIKQLARILEVIGISPGEINTIIDPLLDLWDLRSNVVAHPTREPPHCDLCQHFKELLERCDVAMHKLSELVKSGRLSKGS
ncbi:MAG: hypothetical protein ACPLPW_08590 [bacterium]